MMTPEDNDSLEELRANVKDVATSVKKLTGSVNELTETTRSMQTEFRDGFQTLTSIAEQTSNAVRQVAEAEARSIKRLDSVETRVDRLEN